MTPKFKTLEEVTAADHQAIGGKAYSCARLRQAGLPVPDGIVVPADMTERDIESLASEPSWFSALSANALYAVRSSGADEDGVANSFAGINETRLNVARGELIQAVLACRRSGRSDRAVAYRHERHLDGGDVIAILIQRMVPAIVSGVAFTLNPVSGADELVVNAAPGLGEALVSGQLDPDEYILRKRDLSITSTRRGSGNTSNAVLTPAQLGELGAMLLSIEAHFGAPQDVEFCHDGEQFWIVQSRPVTASGSRLHAAPSTRHPARVTSTQHSASSTQHPEIEWTRANLAEVLPEQVCPQALDLYERILREGENRFFGRLLGPESELGPIVKAFHGRLYFNLSQMRHITTMANAAFADTLRSMGHSEVIRAEDEIPAKAPAGKVIRALPDFIRLAGYALNVRGTFRRHAAMTEQALAKLAADPNGLSDREIDDVLQWWLDIIPRTLKAVFVMSAVQFKEQFVRKACRTVGFPYDELVYPQLSAGEHSVSSQQAYDLDALATAARQEVEVVAYLLRNDGTFADYRSALHGTSFLTAFDRFLDGYGHRGRYESDWSIPRLHEDPAPALFAIRSQLHGVPRSPDDSTRRQDAEAAAAWQAFESKLSAWQRWTLLPRVRSTIRGLKQQYLWRERVRFDLTRVVSRLRAYHLTLANRFVERGWLDTRDDYFLLLLDEVRRAIGDHAYGSTLRTIAAGRGAILAAERDLDMPLFMRQSELAGLRHRPVQVAIWTDGGLTGLCVSPGTVEAEVVVMRDPKEFAAMKRGAILVTRATDPSWTPLFTLASGVVVEVGGMLSHASTIAREYGLPALANVKNATQMLRTGQRVRLDASGGRLTVL